MKTIHKYRLAITDHQVIGVPGRPLRPLCVGFQDGYLTLWARVDTSLAMAEHDIYVVGTGNPIPPDAGGYLGSAAEGLGMWHVFA